MRVLIVDDDPAVNLLSCEILQDSGCLAIGVHCAAAAFEALDGDTKLSALITDIELGAGPDGFAVARRARIANPRLPVIYISGTAATRYPTEGVERSEFLQKPFRPPEFVEAVRRVVRLEAGCAARPADKPNQEPTPPNMGVVSVADSSVWF
jgi:DNA-binding response OmpR family regulator